MRPTHVGWVATLWMAGACSSGNSSQSDTPRVLYVEDTAARDTTPPPPPSPIGRMRLLSQLPVGGLCDVRRYKGGLTDVAAQITYQTNAPRRTITMSVARPPRSFEPLNLQVMGMQSGAGIEETESVFVGFSATGSVTVGTRQYTATGTQSVNERQPLARSDSADAVRFARQLLSLCSLSAP